MKKPILTAVVMLPSALLLLPSAALAQQGAATQWHANAQTLVA